MHIYLPSQTFPGVNIIRLHAQDYKDKYILGYHACCMKAQAKQRILSFPEDPYAN